MFIAVRPSSGTQPATMTASAAAPAPVVVQATVIPNPEALEELLKNGTLKVGDEVYTLLEKRTVESQLPVRLSVPETIAI